MLVAKNGKFCGVGRLENKVFHLSHYRLDSQRSVYVWCVFMRKEMALLDKPSFVSKL